MDLSNEFKQGNDGEKFEIQNTESVWVAAIACNRGGAAVRGRSPEAYVPPEESCVVHSQFSGWAE